MFRRMFIPGLMAAVLMLGGGCQMHPRPTDAVPDALPPAPTAAMPYRVSGMRIQSIPETVYLYTASHTSFDEIAGPATEATSALQRLLSTGTVHSSGPELFVYHDPSENSSAPFDLEIGLPLPGAPASVPAGFAVRKLPPFHCATVDYHGPMKLLPKAYDKLIPQMIAAGLVPSNETRESYLVWESPDSPGNVVRIEVGIDR